MYLQIKFWASFSILSLYFIDIIAFWIPLINILFTVGYVTCGYNRLSWLLVEYRTFFWYMLSILFGRSVYNTIWLWEREAFIMCICGRYLGHIVVRLNETLLCFDFEWKWVYSMRFILLTSICSFFFFFRIWYIIYYRKCRK